MNLLNSALLGILQGVTEFFPVSSSGHLVIIQNLLPGFSQPGVLFDAMLHFGTIIAVLVYYRKTIFKINRKYLFFIFLASIPAAIFGFLFKQQFESMFTNIKLVGVALICTGVINLLSSAVHNQKTELLNNKKSVLIGLMQAIAIIPGISRSGSTIFAGIKLGLSAETAVKFSFLLSIPAILGANLLELTSNSYTIVNWQPYLVGIISAFLAGMVAIKWVIRFLKLGWFKYFAFYCFIVGIIAILL